jgi:hypothetical protein
MLLPFYKVLTMVYDIWTNWHYEFPPPHPIICIEISRIKFQEQDRSSSLDLLFPKQMLICNIYFILIEHGLESTYNYLENMTVQLSLNIRYTKWSLVVMYILHLFSERKYLQFFGVSLCATIVPQIR